MARTRQTPTRAEVTLHARIRKLSEEHEELLEGCEFLRKQCDKFERIRRLQLAYDHYGWSSEHGFVEHVHRLQDIYRELNELGVFIGEFSATRHLMRKVPAPLRLIAQEAFDMTTSSGSHDSFVQNLLDRWSFWADGLPRENEATNEDEEEPEEETQEDGEEEEPEEEAPEDVEEEEPPRKKSMGDESV